jgi:Glycosyl hydrolase family 47
LAELASLSVEFTRLAQITKEVKYFDAVQRITNELEILQDNTKLPGMWPLFLDGSGCNKTTPSSVVHAQDLKAPEDSVSPPKGVNADKDIEEGAQLAQNIAEEALASHKKQKALEEEKSGANGDSALPPGEFNPNPPPVLVETGKKVEKRQIKYTVDDEAKTPPKKVEDSVKAAIEADGDPEDVSAVSKSKPVINKEHDGRVATNTLTEEVGQEANCRPQGLASPPFSSKEQFDLGAMSDSAYEYLPKEWLLLGGLSTQYKTMYEKAINVAKKHILFRPMTLDNRDILIPGHLTMTSVKDNYDLSANQQHLGCFVGGMMAMSSKIFNLKDDLSLAAKLTDGCVWAYENTATGIMPDSFQTLKCEDPALCQWNEDDWYGHVNPDWEALAKLDALKSGNDPKTNENLDTLPKLNNNEATAVDGLKTAVKEETKLPTEKPATSPEVVNEVPEEPEETPEEREAKAKASLEKAGLRDPGVVRGAAVHKPINPLVTPKTAYILGKVLYGKAKLATEQKGRLHASNYQGLQNADDYKHARMVKREAVPEDKPFFADDVLNANAPEKAAEKKNEEIPFKPEPVKVEPIVADTRTPMEKLSETAAKKAAEEKAEIEAAKPPSPPSAGDEDGDELPTEKLTAATDPQGAPKEDFGFGSTHPDKVTPTTEEGTTPAMPGDTEETPKGTNHPSKTKTGASTGGSPEPVLTHKEKTRLMIEKQNLPPGFTKIVNGKYSLRPEAIESVWYM